MLKTLNLIKNMKKLAPKVSTVSDMRRQLEDMELNS